MGGDPIFATLSALAGGLALDAKTVSRAAGRTIDALPDKLFADNGREPADHDTPQEREHREDGEGEH